jgi:putative Holliday junction resolvase
MPRILAVDAGEARIGLAVGDLEGRLAFPLAIIERRGRGNGWAADAIAQRARQERAERVVVGLPLNVDGSEGRQAARARALGERIACASGLPITYWDERMSSFVAKQRIAEAAPAVGLGAHADHVAASVILQTYLDHQAGGEAAR